MNSWFSILPPVVAILCAIYTRRVIVSLLLGIAAGALILVDFGPMPAVFKIIHIFRDVLGRADNIRILLFSLLIGAVVFLIRDSGGVKGFVDFLTSQKWVNTPRKACLMTWLAGTFLFIEGSISILTVGTVARPLFAKFKLSRERLAYLADSTCAPVAVLIPINGWGAYLMSQMGTAGLSDPLGLLVQSMPFFFYPIAAFVLAFATIFIPAQVGPMKAAERRAATSSDSLEPETLHADSIEPRARNLVIPVLTLVSGLFFFLYYTGGGYFLMGDGSRSILYAVILTLLVSYILYRGQYLFTPKEFIVVSLKGMRHLAGIVTILALAFAINRICYELQTGFYVAGILSKNIPAVLIPALIFATSAFIAFATGTSWGTFAIMLSVGVPIAMDLNLHMPLVVGAIVSGGVWGDHSSPISDTTVLSSLASDCNHVSHVRTQMPYALLGGAVSFMLYLAAAICIIGP